MEIADSFRVSTPIDQTWKVLLDIERIAPCLPGAQLQEVDGAEYRGIVKVKVGPITAQYKGTATLAEVDEAAHRILIDAAGRDTRGQGNANASIEVTMAEDGDGTRVEVVTDLAITGKVAQFGRGVLDDVSAKLLRQFVDNLERDVLSGAEPAPAVPGPPGPGVGVGATIAAAPDPTAPTAAAAGTAGTPASVGTGESTSNGVSSGTGPRRIESAEVEPIDLLEVAGGSAARRLVPIAIAVLGLFVLWRVFRARS